MWIFTTKGFVSIKQDKDNPNKLLVRARARGDLEKMFPDCEVEEGTGTDYRFRTTLPRYVVAAYLLKEIADLYYTDGFKTNIEDYWRREPFYLRVWETMADMQDRFEMQEGGKK